jgi:tyrosyl-tRNA synthetase
MRNVIEQLEERGFIDALTSEELKAHVNQPISVYCGFDPTADSLHLGNLVGIIALGWFQRCGHTPIAIVGGATGMIGDPGGKSQERNLLDEKTIAANLVGIRKNLESVLHQGPVPPKILNNFDWFKKFSFIDFLRDVGKHFRMGPMMSKDSVKKRLESEEGMSFTEFSYQTLQGYDFLYLYQNHGVTLQIGGSDQWGNITAGTDLVRKVLGESVFGMTFPLLVKSDGQKFGKSEKGAIWLSPEKLSPYEFYQHLFRTADADVGKLLRMLTYLEMDEIRSLEAAMQKPDYVPNSVQKRLAEEVTRLVHGEEALQQALRVTAAAKPGAAADLDLATLHSLAGEMPLIEISQEELVGSQLIELLPRLKLLPSKSEARRLIKNGGLYLNNQKIDAEDASVSQGDLLGGEALLLALGKKNKIMLKVKKSA